MNAFEKIKKELRAKKDNVAHNLQLFKDKKIGDMVTVCQSKLDAYIDALSIVYEVEAEYTKNIMDELSEAKKNCGEDSDCSQCVFGCEDGCRLQELQITGGNNGWIPCNERLPEKCGRYITTNMYEGEKEEVFDLWYEDGKWSYDVGEDETIRIVIAWMPLPEPYKPEGGAKDESTDM